MFESVIKDINSEAETDQNDESLKTNLLLQALKLIEQLSSLNLSEFNNHGCLFLT